MSSNVFVIITIGRCAVRRCAVVYSQTRTGAATLARSHHYNGPAVVFRNHRRNGPAVDINSEPSTRLPVPHCCSRVSLQIIGATANPQNFAAIPALAGPAADVCSLRLPCWRSRLSSQISAHWSSRSRLQHYRTCSALAVRSHPRTYRRNRLSSQISVHWSSRFRLQHYFTGRSHLRTYRPSG